MRSHLLAMVALFLVTLTSLVAQEKTWTGNGGGGAVKTWSDPLNWSGNTIPVGNDSLVFPSVTNKSADNTLTANTALGPIAINASGYTLSGNTITLNGGLILNGSGSTATVALPMILDSSQGFIVSQSNAVMTLTQAISGAGGLTKSGDGMLTINGTHSYTGPTIVAGGSLNVTQMVPTEVKIISGALIGGGTVPGISAQNQGVAVIAPGVGAATGTLTSNGNVRMYATDQLHFLLANDTTADKLVVTGTVTLNGSTIVPSLATGYNPTASDDTTWVLIQNDGTDAVITGGDPSDYLFPLTIGGLPFQLSLVGGIGRNDVVLRRESDAVPGTVALSIFQVGTTTPTSNIGAADQVDLRVQVTGSVSGSTVSFFSGATFIDDVILNGAGMGTITVPSGTLASGTHSLTALFEGSDFQAPKRSAIGGLNVAGDQPTVTLAVTPSGTSTPGATVMLAVNLDPGVLGSIVFKDGTTTLSTVALDGNGDASFTTATLVAGGHSLQAFFVPGTGFIANNSAVVAHTVTPNTATTVTLTSSQNPAVAGSAITLQAAVTPGATGDVAFYDGNALLGTRTVSGATASFVTGGLSTGTHAITAVYLGSTTHTPEDAQLSQVMTAPPGGGGSSGGSSDEESGGCGLGSGTAALAFGLLLLIRLRLRRE